MERKSEDITLIARLGFLIYANGYTAQIGGMKQAKDQQGNDVWEFLLSPSDELVKRYDLKPNNKGTMTYITQLPYDLVIQLNADPSWTRYLYLRTYDGASTPEIKKLKGTTQQEIIAKLNNQINILKMQLENVEEKLYVMQSDMPKYLDRNVKPIMEQMMPMMEKLVKKND